MVALALDQVTSVALVVVLVLVGLAIASAWIMKEITQKIVVVVILGLLALLVWTQRASLEECADKVRATGAAFDDPGIDTTCSFFGRDVQINRNRGS